MPPTTRSRPTSSPQGTGGKPRLVLAARARFLALPLAHGSVRSVTGPSDHLTPLGRALAADAGLRKALLAWATRQMATAQDVEDLVRQTLAAALESEAEWDAKNVPPARFVGSIINVQSRTLRRRVDRQAGSAFDEEQGPRAPTDVPDPERVLLERDAEIDRRRVKEELRVATGELEALAKKPIAELEESIRQGGHDPAEADAILAGVLAGRLAAATPPSANDAPAAPRSRRSTEPPPPSKVVDLSQARTKRRPLAPWLLAAAMLLVVIDVALTHKDVIVARFTPALPPAPSVPTPPPSTEPTPQKIAADLRADALRECAKHFFGGCEAELDRAKNLDPEGENAPQVKKAREDIAEAADAAASDWAKPGDSPAPAPK